MLNFATQEQIEFIEIEVELRDCNSIDVIVLLMFVSQTV